MSDNSRHIDWKVEGMTCSNCARRVNEFLEEQGAEDIYIDFTKDEVEFNVLASGDLDDWKEGIEALGYQVREDEGDTSWWTLERKLIIAALFTIPLLLHHLLMLSGWSFHWLENGWIQLTIASPAFAIGAWHFGKSAWGSVKALDPNMDVLIITGSTAAFIYSLIGTFLGEPDYLFYETSVSIITLVLLGNVLEKRAVRQTTQAIEDFSRLQPEFANRWTGDGMLEQVPVEKIEVGDELQVNQGDKVPADSVILNGDCTVDESLLTGESDPVYKMEGDRLVGASVLLQGQVRTRVLATGAQSFLGRLIEMVKTAQQEKPDIQRLADRISAIFVPAVIAIALGVFAFSWGMFDLSLQSAVMNSIAVLVISCPCAMGLATPAAVMVGVGRAARDGILIRGAQTLEQFAGIEHLILDKTGTLTTGKLTVEKIELNGMPEEEVYRIIYSLEMRSSHPIARALAQSSKAKITEAPIQWKEAEEVSGMGVRALDEEGNEYAIGAFDRERSGLVRLTKNGKEIARITMGETLRDRAHEAVEYFKNEGVHLHLASGDREEKVAAIGKELGIEDYKAGMSPEEKFELIERYKKQGRTAMVGDGINDATALATAHIGVSFSQASDLAMQTAKIVLVNSGLDTLARTLSISKQTLLTIKQNLFWAFIYNLIAIPLAAAGYLSPIWAAGFMAFSDLVVIGNSIRFKYKHIGL